MLLIARKAFYDVNKTLRQLWGSIMPEEYGDDRLVITLRSDDAVELERLGESFGGLARQFRRHLEDEGVDPTEAPSKLLVTGVSQSSIEFELATLVALYSYATAGADGFLIWQGFYHRIRGVREYLVGHAPRPPHYTRQDARDLNAFFNVVASKKGSSVKIRRAKYHKRDGRRETLAEFDLDEQDVVDAHVQLGADMSDFDQSADNAPPPRHRLENNVPFIWYRTDREKGKAKGFTSDRGVIAKVSEKPLPVHFASEIENQKDMMTKAKDRNPFSLVYLVDVAIEVEDEDTPRSYTILNIHQIIGGDED